MRLAQGPIALKNWLGVPQKRFNIVSYFNSCSMKYMRMPLAYKLKVSQNFDTKGLNDPFKFRLILTHAHVV